MNGPEHYRAAEMILAELQQFQATLTGDMDPAEYEEAVNLLTINVGQAQVHATLALAAATALNDAEQGFMVEDLHAWRDVASVMPEGAA